MPDAVEDTPLTDIIDELRSWAEPNPGSTHYAGCWTRHRDCLLLIAADEIERLRRDVTDTEQALSRNVTIIMKQAEEIRRLRDLIRDAHDLLDRMAITFVPDAEYDAILDALGREA